MTIKSNKVERHALKGFCKGPKDSLRQSPQDHPRQHDVQYLPLIILGLPVAIVASLAVVKNAATLVDIEMIYLINK